MQEPSTHYWKLDYSRQQVNELVLLTKDTIHATWSEQATNTMFH